MTNALDDIFARLNDPAAHARELDAHLYAAFYSPPLGQCRAVREEYAGGVHWNVKTSAGATHRYDIAIPAFVTSLDAAITFCREQLPGHEWAVWVDHENGTHWAKVGTENWDDNFEDVTTRAQAPALALCIATVGVLHRASAEKAA